MFSCRVENCGIKLFVKHFSKSAFYNTRQAASSISSENGMLTKKRSNFTQLKAS
jgi:hypothetical protein